MELVLRVMNDLDILCNPLYNGIASKKLIYDCTKSYLESIDGNYLSTLTLKERDLYIKDNMNKYILDHNRNLEKKFSKRNLDIRNVIYSFVNNKDKYSYYLLLYFLSSLNNHLVNGSKVYTEWISTSNNFDSIFKYYDNQQEHKVMVALLPTNGVYNEDTLVVDVSNKESIEKIKCLSKKIDKNDVYNFIKLINDDFELERISNELFHKFIFNRTSKKFMGYNFSKKSNEICVYQYINPNYILSVLEQIQIDLICADRFDINYLSLSKNLQIKELIELKERLKKMIIASNNSFDFYVFEQLYLKNKNIKFISSSSEDERKIIDSRNRILAKTLTIPSLIIKNN